MTKNELIEKLQSINGNPVILLDDDELGCVLLKNVQLEKMHRSKYEPGEYVTDFSFEGETGYNTFYHDNYRKEIDECILLSLI